MTTENFADLFQQSIQKQNIHPGAVITARVVSIDKDFVLVDANLKSEGVIAREQFLNEKGELTVNVGDVTLYLFSRLLYAL